MSKNKTQKRILLIEDDEPITIAYRKSLSDAGFKVYHIPNGENVIEIIKEIVPDIILLDLIMPKRDGFEVLGDIDKYPEFKKIPIIILTNLEEDFYTRDVKKNGVVDLLIKSEHSIKDILEKINQVLGK